MAAEYQVVDIWVGHFPSETAFDEYFSEDYEKEDDDAPISQFGADMDASFYDHDFFESAYYEKPSEDLKALLKDHSFSSSYTPQAVAAYQKLNPGAINTVILMWGKEIEDPQSVQGDGYALHYLGRFDCDPKA